MDLTAKDLEVGCIYQLNSSGYIRVLKKTKRFIKYEYLNGTLEDVHQCSFTNFDEKFKVVCKLIPSLILTENTKDCIDFLADDSTSSATICKNCGREKFLHYIGPQSINNQTRTTNDSSLWPTSK